MDELKDILVPIIVVIGILLSAFSKKKTPNKGSTPPIPKRAHGDDWLKELSPQGPPPLTKKRSKQKGRKTVPSKATEKMSPPLFINENPEDEGQRALGIEESEKDVYGVEGTKELASMEDWRRAIIAHEILKRKF